MSTVADVPVVFFASPDDWAAWLAEHHDETAGVWLKIAKKNTGITSVDYAHALDVALCYGWIDGQRRGFDATYFLQRFTPRRPGSIWSKVNCDKAMRLIEEGRMQPAGRCAVERARADGRWDAAYEPQRTAQVPADLQAALDRNPSARDFFATLSGANRYAILFRVATARKPETRVRRIESFVAMLAERKTIYP